MEPLRSGGSLFKKSELVECSLVAVPANANAISIAKSLGISVSVQDMIFAKPGKEDHFASGRRIIGKSAARTIEHHERSAAMVPIAQRIIEAENHLNALRDDFNAHLEQVDNSDVSDADVETRNEFNAKIALATRNLDSCGRPRRISRSVILKAVAAARFNDRPGNRRGRSACRRRKSIRSSHSSSTRCNGR